MTLGTQDDGKGFREEIVNFHTIKNYAHQLINYETLEETDSHVRHRLCMISSDFVQKKFFNLIKPDQIDDEIDQALRQWQEELKKEDEQFEFLTKYLIPNTNIILNIKRFNISLLEFIKTTLERSHPVFTDYDAFMKSKVEFLQPTNLKLKFKSFHQHIYIDSKSARLNYVKLKYSRSPDSLINGLRLQQQIKIDDYAAFVYRCFQFRKDHVIPEVVGDFNIQDFGFKHTLTTLFFELRKEGLITSTLEDVKDLLMQLLRKPSRASLDKYSSEAKWVKQNNRIDIQLFK